MNKSEQANALREAINSFPLRRKCADAEFAHGDCDNISQAFIEHAESFGLNGTMLAVDSPRFKLKGSIWSSDELISHYIAFFEPIGIGVDWSARQLRSDAKVPIVMTKKQVKSSWRELPFGWEDARKHEHEVAGSFLAE